MSRAKTVPSSDPLVRVCRILGRNLEAAESVSQATADELRAWGARESIFREELSEAAWGAVFRAWLRLGFRDGLTAMLQAQADVVSEAIEEQESVVRFFQEPA